MHEDSLGHVHTEACEPEVPAASQDPLLAQLTENKKPLSEAEFRKLRGKYFTVRHHTVAECGHKLDMINEPTFRNCEYCWFAFFSSHGELIQVTDEAFQTHGAAFLDKMRGRHYRKMFTRYMSTLSAFKLEADAMKAAQEKLNEQQSGEVQSGGDSRENVGQGEGYQDVSTAGGQSQPGAPESAHQSSND